MLTEYLEKNLQRARYKILADGTYFGEIPGVRGVWASAKNLEDCRRELKQVLEDWLLLRIRDRSKIPGFRVRHDQRHLVRHA